MKTIKVSVVIGSDSDLNIMQDCFDILKDFGVSYEFRILSAHRAHDLLQAYIVDAISRGACVFIAAAGYAAHLGGVIASQTVCPVIGIPVDSSSLKGLDALLSTVQMPGGVPVATTSIGKAGAKNAALLAIQMLAISDNVLKEKLKKHREKMIEEIEKKNATYIQDYKA